MWVSFILMLIGSIIGGGYVYIYMQSVVKDEQLASYVKGYVAAHSKAYYEGWEQCKEEAVQVLQNLIFYTTTREEKLVLEKAVDSIKEATDGKPAMDSVQRETPL